MTTRCSASTKKWARSKTRLMLRTRGIWIALLKWRWMRCGCRTSTMSRCFRVVNAAGPLCAGCCCPSRTFCCWTSRPTTSMLKPSGGSSGTWPTTPGWWSPSPTTATSSMRWPSGSSNLTAGRATRSTGTTRDGWSRSKNACAKKSVKSPLSNASSKKRPTGSSSLRKAGAPKPRPGSRLTSHCSTARSPSRSPNPPS